MADWLEQLQIMKDGMKDIETKTSFDTKSNRQNQVMSTIEEANPDLSLKSKAYGLSSKFIFKQLISYENAERIIKAVNKKELADLSEYKRQLTNVCTSILQQGESPIEMLLYATKGIIDSRDYVNAVLDVLKELNIYDGNLIEIYRNILKEWTWPEQLQLVIKSAITLQLDTLGPELLYLMENNDYVRQEAANAIIFLKLDVYYENVVSLLLCMKTQSRDVTGMMMNIFSNMARTSAYGAECIFRAYVDSNNRVLDNLIIPALRNNISANNINTIMKYTTSKNEMLQRKALLLLGKFSSTVATDILIKSSGHESINKMNYCIALGYTKDNRCISILKNILEDAKNSEDVRTTALISLANMRENELTPYIESYINKSPEFDIAASSVLVQLGKKEKLTNIFRYFVSQNTNEKHLRFAMKELNRLRGLRMSEINTSLNLVSKKILSNDKEFMVMNVVTMLTRGMVDDEVAEILLDKLVNTEIQPAKILILESFGKNFTNFSTALRTKVRNVFVKCNSEDRSSFVRDKAMECLKLINRGEVLSPSMEV